MEDGFGASPEKDNPDRIRQKRTLVAEPILRREPRCHPSTEPQYYLRAVQPRLGNSAPGHPAAVLAARGFHIYQVQRRERHQRNQMAQPPMYQARDCLPATRPARCWDTRLP